MEGEMGKNDERREDGRNQKRRRKQEAVEELERDVRRMRKLTSSQ